MSCKELDAYLKSRVNVCLMVSDLDKHKQSVYDSIRKELNNIGHNADIKVHHGNQDIFARLLCTFLGKYTHYVIVPYFQEEPNNLTIRLINEIPESKLIFLDRDFQPKRHKCYGAILQNYEDDLFHTLNNSIEKIEKYNRFILIFPPKKKYPTCMIDGFAKFCALNLLDFMIKDSVNEFHAAEGDLYLVLDDADLVDLIKLSKEKSFHIGDEIGVISYNHNPFKEILEDGISVVSYDFDQMARRAVEMIVTGNLKIENNTFTLTHNLSF